MQKETALSPRWRMLRGVSSNDPREAMRRPQLLGLVNGAFLTLLLFVPKANVLTFRDTYVGAKPEDLFVVLCWLPAVVFLVWRRRAVPDERPVRVLLGLVAAYLIYIWSSVWFNDSSLTYVVRYSFYVAPLVILPALRLDAVRLATVNRRITRLVFCALLFYLVLVIAQREGAIGGFLLGTYVDHVSHRPMAIFSHPTELGIISIVLLTLLLFSDGRLPLKHVYCGIVLAINAFAANRTSLAALLALYLLFFVRSWRSQTDTGRRLLVICSIALTIEALALAPVILERFAQEGATSGEVASASAPGFDPSAAARLETWRAVWTTSVATWSTLAFGSGVGRFGPHVDGFYVRVLGESGVIGLLLHGFIFWQLASIFRRMPAGDKLTYVLLAMLVHSISLDAWYFSRAGYLVWLVFALYVSCCPVPSAAEMQR